MEYEVVDKDEGTMDGSSWGGICEERKKRGKVKLWSRRKGNQHQMTRRISHDISIEKA